MLLLYFVAAGLLIGRLRGGRISALGAVRFRWAGVAVVGLFSQVLLFSTPLGDRVGSLGPALYVASTALVLLALVGNLNLPGFWLITFGAVLNLLVIAANGGYMPSSPEAWAGLNGIAGLPTTAFSNSTLAGPHTLLAGLGDVFYLPRPIPFANVFSIGDVLIGVGAAWFLVRTMHGAGTASTAAQRVSTISAATLGGAL